MSLQKQLILLKIIIRRDLSKIEFLNIKGQEINLSEICDYIFSIGVIHHIPEAELVCANIFKSLKKNGKFIFWVYGRENELYLLIFNNLRRFTSKMPDFILRRFCFFLNLMCYIYIFFCRYINLPMKDYLLNAFNKFSFEKRNYIIFDQLNPSYSKYYKKEDLEKLLIETGFENFKIFNRLNYSWLAIATK